MRSVRPAWLVVGLLCWIGVWSGWAAAQTDLQPTVVIVIDRQHVMQESAAARSVEEQIDGYREVYRHRFAELEEELRSIEAELGELRGTLTPEEFHERQRAFERRIADAQREAQIGRNELDRGYDGAMDKINETLLDLIIGIAQEHGADLVLDQSVAIVSSRSLDFTDLALERLDAALDWVDVVLPNQPASSPIPD